jgi:hypothetical protein
MKQYRLLKPLPGCPAGRLFGANTNGIYYHIMTEAEALQDGLKMYHFNAQDIIDNPDFFEECTDNYIIEIYDPIQFGLVKRVDSGIPNLLVNTIQESLNELKDNFSISSLMGKPDKSNLCWYIQSRQTDKTKYKVLLQKHL